MEIPSPEEQLSEQEKLIPDKPGLRYIEKTISLLESEKGPDGEEINWKNLYEKVGPWESGLELSENIREVVVEYILSKFPAIKEKIPSIGTLPDDKLLNALGNGWFEELGEEISGTRREILLAVLAHITKRIESRIYRNIIEKSDTAGLEKLGLNENLSQLTSDVLEVSVKSDPMFIRFLAYSQLSPKPPEGANESAPMGQDGKPHTWAELFPHEANFISKKLIAILETHEKWDNEPGAEDFKEYIGLLQKFFSETDVEGIKRLKEEVESTYAKLVSSDFPILIAPPTGSYYKPPYFDPELRVLLKTPDAKESEKNFRSLQESLADELKSLNLEKFSDNMRSKVAKSVISIGDYGASLTFTAAAEADKAITLFLNEQIRHYDRDLVKFLKLIEMPDDPFSGTPIRRIEEMSSEDTMMHEFSHSVYSEDTPEAKRLGAESESVIAEISAESIHRGVAKELLETGRIKYTPEQYIAVTICMPLQIIERTNDTDDEYFKAAVFVLNGMFEQDIIEFNGSKIIIKDRDGVFSYLKDNAKKIISLYENREITPKKAKEWISANCSAGTKLQEFIDFIQKSDIRG